MKIMHRKAAERGQADHGWLKAQHSFSFANYFAPDHMGFHSLRVMNEDRIHAGQGFGTHPHRDMEILTYVMSGQLEHKDSLGNGAVIEAGEFQRMTAGSGIEHSEFNPSPDQETHLYQIWLHPSEKNLPPSHEQGRFDLKDNALTLVSSHDGREGSFKLNQFADVYLGKLTDSSMTFNTHFGNVWVQVVSGSVIVEGQKAHAGDGVAIEYIDNIQLSSEEEAQVLLFDLKEFSKAK